MNNKTKYKVVNRSKVKLNNDSLSVSYLLNVKAIEYENKIFEYTFYQVPDKICIKDSVYNQGDIWYRIHFLNTESILFETKQTS